MAVSLRLFSLIFLRLIKTIIASLICATVVIAKWEGEFGKEHPSKIVREAIEP